MGPDVSRCNNAYADQSTKRVRELPTQAGPLARTRHMNGVATSTTQQCNTAIEPVPDEEVLDGIGTPPKSLKRSPDERDQNDYQRDRPARSRTPPYAGRSGRIDHYSPPREPKPVSPLNTRHAFIPERGGQRTPSLGTRRKVSDASLHRIDTLGRGISGSPPLRSSPSRQLSSHRRRSPVGRSHPGSADLMGSRLNSSPPIHVCWDGDTRDKPLYKNLTWTAPGLPSKQKSYSAMPVYDEAGPEKVAFNGLEGVPTGPKCSIAPATDIAYLPLMEREANRQPHIFISGESLPPDFTIVMHLFGFLRQYILDPSNILMDRTGYYILFEDTADGRKRLKNCYSQKNREKMFKEYSIEMKCSQGMCNGSRVDNESWKEDDLAKTNSTKYDELKEMVAYAKSCTTQRDASSPIGHASGPQRLLEPLSARPDRHASKSTDPVSHAGSASSRQRHSFPLRVPCRQDRDDSSSISGFTGSEISASKVPKCHSCKLASLADTDSLVQCQSCPRRYHRRCHTQPPIPTTLETDHGWQCRRCIKKQIPSKSRLSNSSSVGSNSPAPSVGQSESEKRPTKKRRLQDKTLTLRTTITDKDDISVVAEESVVTKTSLQDDPDQDGATENTSVDPAEHTLVIERSPIPSDELHSKEADNLVQKSFTLPETLEQSSVKLAKPAKFKFMRKKFIRPPIDVGQNELSKPQNSVAPAPIDGVEGPTLTDDEYRGGNGTTTPKPKSHKWAGGGADKVIVQAGMGHFAVNNVFRLDTSQLNGVDSEVEEPTEAATRARELHGSPEGSTRSYDVERTRSVAELPPKASVSLKSKVRPKNTGLPVSKKNGPNESNPATGQLQRMKPSNPTFGKCSQCGKTIAINPSGENKLCSRCKKETSADSTMHHALPSDAPLGHSKRDSIGRQAEGNVAGDTVASDAVSTHESNAGNHFTSNEASGATSVPSSSFPRRTKPRTSCDMCRLHHRQCNHSTTVPTKDATPQAHNPMSKEDENPRSDAEAEDDIDFWRPNINEACYHNNQLRTTTFKPSLNKGLSTTSGLENDGPDRVSFSPGPHLADHSPKSPSKAQAARKKQRQSHTTVARDEYDIGDSFQRPANSYAKLICMALWDSPGYCLRSTEIVDWVHNNVPSYNKGENGGRWESGLKATLSLNREGEGTQLWKKITHDGAKKHDACWWQLLPGKANTMLRWDPVLKTPVSPANRWNDEPKRGVGQESRDEIYRQNQFVAAMQRYAQGGENMPSLGQSKSELKARPVERVMKETERRPAPALPDQIDVDVANEPDVDELDLLSNPRPSGSQGGNESSEEEPIAASRRMRCSNKPTAATVAPMKAISLNGSDESLDNIVSQVKRTEEDVSPITPVSNAFVKQTATLNASDQFTLAQLIKADAVNHDHSAKSLFDEWPEYDPANQFDRELKIAEIRRRPTRKQKFGKPSRDPWLDWKPARANRRDVSRDSSMSVERTNKSSRDVVMDAYPWETGEGNVVPVDTLEELFGLPNNPIPIVHEGQLAYRDGTRNDDGSLPRAKNIYKTGYA